MYHDILKLQFSIHWKCIVFIIIIINNIILGKLIIK